MFKMIIDVVGAQFCVYFDHCSKIFHAEGSYYCHPACNNINTGQL